MEQSKQYTPEEIAGLEKSRTISDAELLKGGAEYVVDEKGIIENLLATETQKEKVGNHKIEAERARLDAMQLHAKMAGMYHFGMNMRGEKEPKSIPVKIKFRDKALVVSRDGNVRDNLFHFVGDLKEGVFELLRFSDHSVTISKVKPEAITQQERGGDQVAIIVLEEIESIERLEK